MTLRVGINGFGRIGKNIYKILVRKGVEVPLVNTPSIDLESMMHALKYDSVYLKDKLSIEKHADCLIVNGIKTCISNHRTPEDIPWDDYKIDYVIECTGVFLSTSQAEKHKCKRVILSAPSNDAPMYVFGVNHTELAHMQYTKVISAASCTTTCLAPIAKLLNDKYGIIEGLMSTVHSVTPSQAVCDKAKTLHRTSRSYLNIIPSTTGAAKAVTKVLPELEGKLDGMAYRVPVLDVSVVDLVVKLKKKTSLSEIEKTIQLENEKNPGIIFSTNEPLVSSDFIGDTHSCIFDYTASLELSSTFFKIVCWYDNEHGYSCRVVDLLLYLYSHDNK